MGHKYTKIVSEGSTTKGCLYLGSIDFIVEDEILSDLCIDSIVSVLPHQPSLIPEVLEKHHIDPSDYMVYHLEDNAVEYISLFSTPSILSATKFIHKRLKDGRVVLVHCDAGITRSPAVVIAYLMQYGTELDKPQILSLNKALEVVKNLRQNVDICVFHKELIQLEALLSQGAYIPDEPYMATPIIKDSLSSNQSDYGTNLTANVLQTSWKAVRDMDGGLQGFGNRFYKKLITEGDNDVKAMFRMDLDQQSRMVTHMVQHMLLCVTDQDINKLVQMHKRLNISRELMELFQSIFVATLKEALKDQWSEAISREWNTFFTSIFDIWFAQLSPPKLALPPCIVINIETPTPILQVPTKPTIEKMDLFVQLVDIREESDDGHKTGCGLFSAIQRRTKSMWSHKNPQKTPVRVSPTSHPNHLSQRIKNVSVLPCDKSIYS